MTEPEKTGVEILLSQPEIVAWLELSEQEIVTLLQLHKSEKWQRRGAEGGVEHTRLL